MKIFLVEVSRPKYYYVLANSENEARNIAMHKKLNNNNSLKNQFFNKKANEKNIKIIKQVYEFKPESKFLLIQKESLNEPYYAMHIDPNSESEPDLKFTRNRVKAARFNQCDVKMIQNKYPGLYEAIEEK